MSYIAPFVGVIGILLGALASYVFSLKSEASKNFQKLRNEAYVDYVKSVSALAISQRMGQKEKEFDATLQLADARSRIAIYGSRSVGKALSKFLHDYNHLNSPDALNAYCEVVRLMRLDSPSQKETLDTLDISRILYGSDKK